jgi:plasmid stabilization system protein ParE
MNPHRSFRLLPGAAQHITEIWQHIAEDNIVAAGRVVDDIFAAISGLAPFPNQGHTRPDLSSAPLRFPTIYDYLVAYAPDETPLLVIAVLHGRRSPRVLAAILRERK